MVDRVLLVLELAGTNGLEARRDKGRRMQNGVLLVCTVDSKD